MRKIIVAILALAAILVVADFGAAFYANRSAQAAVRNTANLGSDPKVDIHGFPFLTQAAAGKFDDVEVTADHVGSGAFGDLDVQAHLYGVEIPFDDLVSRNLHTIRVDRLEANVSFPALRPLALLDVAGLLPFGVVPTGIDFVNGEIVVTGSGSNLVVDLDQLKK